MWVCRGDGAIGPAGGSARVSYSRWPGCFLWVPLCPCDLAPNLLHVCSCSVGVPELSGAAEFMVRCGRGSPVRGWLSGLCSGLVGALVTPGALEGLSLSPRSSVCPPSPLGRPTCPRGLLTWRKLSPGVGGGAAAGVEGQSARF